ncbi:MAG: PD-(D/E)XK nuclease family transposase [Lachnospiraceae bacterium]|nr:PD-(D/E)XK nuclease family transposase [Lachnospiraceae bacterium]
MQLETNIAKVVDEVSLKARYDTEVKKVLSDVQILAWILKYAVREFKDSSIKEIIACIEGEPEVAVCPVHSGHYIIPVEGISTEAAELASKKVTFDIRFKAAVPEFGPVGMIINVEAQNKFYESYDLVSRGVFYCARMLSTQVRNEEAASEYNNLQKVYSIWICLDVPVNSEYTITGYRMKREDIYGCMDSRANQRYDLMELVMICLGSPETVENGTELHKLLNVVLSDQMTPEEKKKVMREEFEIVTSVELEGGLAKMCNLSDHIEEKGMEKGIEKGYLQAILSLVKDGLLTVEMAAERVNRTREEFQVLYKDYLKEQNN